MTLNVAGEILVKSNNRSHMVSNGLTIKYISDLIIRRNITEMLQKLVLTPRNLGEPQGSWPGPGWSEQVGPLLMP